MQYSNMVLHASNICPLAHPPATCCQLSSALHACHLQQRAVALLACSASGYAASQRSGWQRLQSWQRPELRHSSRLRQPVSALLARCVLLKGVGVVVACAACCIKGHCSC